MFGAGRARLQAEVFGELAAMVHAGVNIGEALGAVAEDLHDRRMAAALAQAGREVSRGRRLGESLGRHERVFSPLTVAMVEVGENSGRLEQALRNAQQYHERDFELRHLLTRELAYPIVLFGAILLIPLLGQAILVWVTDTFQAAALLVIRQLLLYAILLGVPAGAIALIWRNMSNSEQGRIRLHGMLLSIPIVGGVLRKLAVARFCRALASLYSSGVLLGTSVRLAGDAACNAKVRHELTRNVAQIDGGGSLSEALEGSPLVPRAVLTMLKTGERTGDIDGMAHNVAEHLEREAETSTKQLAVSLTPVAVLIAGVIVAIMLLSFYTGYAARLIP